MADVTIAGQPYKLSPLNAFQTHDRFRRKLIAGQDPARVVVLTVACTVDGAQSRPVHPPPLTIDPRVLRLAPGKGGKPDAKTGAAWAREAAAPTGLSQKDFEAAVHRALRPVSFAARWPAAMLDALKHGEYEIMAEVHFRYYILFHNGMKQGHFTVIGMPYAVRYKVINWKPCVMQQGFDMDISGSTMGRASVHQGHIPIFREWVENARETARRDQQALEKKAKKKGVRIEPDAEGAGEAEGSGD